MGYKTIYLHIPLKNFKTALAFGGNKSIDLTENLLFTVEIELEQKLEKEELGDGFINTPAYKIFKHHFRELLKNSVDASIAKDDNNFNLILIIDLIWEENKAATVKITDNGAGFPEFSRGQNINYFYSKLAKFNSSTKSLDDMQLGGANKGLYLLASFLRQAGGELLLGNSKTKGAEITIKSDFRDYSLPTSICCTPVSDDGSDHDGELRFDLDLNLPCFVLGRAKEKTSDYEIMPATLTTPVISTPPITLDEDSGEAVEVKKPVLPRKGFA